MPNSKTQGTTSLGDVEDILSDQRYLKVAPVVWDTGSLSYVVYTTTMAGGGGPASALLTRSLLGVGI